MKIETLEIAGFMPAINGMRNPMNSWDRSDSYNCNLVTNNCNWCPSNKPIPKGCFFIGENDLQLAQNLILAGAEHSKFMRQIQVWANFDMPRYWWSEFDTYGFNSKNSCSTMHTLMSKPITCDMFVTCEEDRDLRDLIILRLEHIRKQYNIENEYAKKTRLLLRAKRLLMEGFLQLRTVNTNYAELRNIYFQRRNHRLQEEWIDIFCAWVETLPYAKDLIILERKEKIW